MKAAAIIILTLLVLGGGVVALTRNGGDKQSATNTSNNGSDTSKTESPIGPNAVEMRNLAFTPKKITVKKGTKVTWTNRDSAKHDVVADEATAAFPPSELFGENQSHSVTFDTVGTYNYHCTPHPFMKATIEVTE